MLLDIDTLGSEKRVDVPMGGGQRWFEVAPSAATTTIALVLSHEGVPAGVETGIRLTTLLAVADHVELQAHDVDAGDVLHWEGMPPVFAFRDRDGNGLEIVEQVEGRRSSVGPATATIHHQLGDFTQSNEWKVVDMKTASSHDGTKIAYDEQGQGPALILVNGAMTTRSSGSNPELADLLAQHLTVYSFDRRGRGESDDTLPYAVAREIEDIDALIAVAGGTASLYGHSSGACLALEAVGALGERVKRLAMYEAPYNDDPEAKRAWGEYIEQLTDALAAGRRGDAIALFMGYVGVPSSQIAGMRQAPFWSGLEAVAPTLAYDHTALLGSDGATPVERASRVSASTLVMYGGDSFAFMGETARTLSHAMPSAQLRTLEGQTHEVDPAVLAPVLIDFFAQD